MRRASPLLWSVLAIAAAYSLALAHSFRCNNVDDAYIAFRYAWNLVRGHGLVFNPGERVEGYTSFLWTIWMAPWTRLGVDIVWFSIAFGLLASLAALCGLYAHVRLQVQRGGDRWLLAALPLVALDNSYAFWAVGGMETALFTALVVWSIYAALAWRGPRAALGCGVLLGFTTLVRPEGALLFALIVAQRLLLRTPESRREIAPLAAGFAALVLPHLLWRRVYYGAWLPNTFHNKVELGGAAVAVGAAYAWKLVAWRAGEPLLALLVFANPRVVRGMGLYVAWVLAYVTYVIVIGGDWPVANRFFVPVLPFVHLLAVQGVLNILDFVLPRRAAAGKLMRGALLGAIVALVALVSYRHAESEGMVRRNDNVGVETQRKRFGLWLRENIAPETLIATGPSGAIPYYSRLPTLDMWGLTDAHIARMQRFRFQPGHDRTDLQYILTRRPAFIIGNVGFQADRIPAGYRPITDDIPLASRPRELVLARLPAAR